MWNRLNELSILSGLAFSKLGRCVLISSLIWRTGPLAIYIFPGIAAKKQTPLLYKLTTTHVPNCFHVVKAPSKAEGVKVLLDDVGNRNEIALEMAP